MRRIEQGLEINQTEIGRPKVTDVYYNTVQGAFLTKFNPPKSCGNTQ